MSKTRPAPMRLTARIYTFVLILVTLPLSSASDNTTLACNNLQTLLDPSVVQFPPTSNDPNSAGNYTSTITSTWNLFNAEFTPTCIVFPRTSSDVQVAMKEIFDSDVNYAVKAGGHSAMKGWNNVDNGILIAFDYMNHISYDPIKDTITMEPAIRWGEAVTALESQGVAPVGGRVDDVGTGLLLGGGLSFLSPAHGFSADNFVELDVVLVNGTMVTATQTNEYADLFKSLKGGGNRFGIVTRYEVRAVHVGTKEDKNWFGGSIMYPEASFDALAKAVLQYTQDNNDPNAAILVYFGALVLPDNTLFSFAMANLFHNNPSESLFNITFSPFLSIQPIISTTLGPLSYHDIAFSLTEPLPSNGHGQLFGATVLSSSPGSESEQAYIDTVHQWINFTKNEALYSELNTTVLAFTPIPVSQIVVGRQRGGNVIDPPLEAYNAVQFQVTLKTGIKSVSREMEEAREVFFEKWGSSFTRITPLSKRV
ncbi:hypothetical protein VKT23_013020 [Stygiomarasmius scandens]|uniref:FAD-binding PCMH-type domain-containing protein n=1 Tax=Marasmiellus scandens TaxID=2682957 RepID=A0ABR1J6X5_9AGAR